MQDYSFIVREFLALVVNNAPFGFSEAKFELGDIDLVVSTMLINDEPMIDVTIEDLEYGTAFRRIVPVDDILEHYDKWVKSWA
jgi:hypothetical protein